MLRVELRVSFLCIQHVGSSACTQYMDLLPVPLLPSLARREVSRTSVPVMEAEWQKAAISKGLETHERSDHPKRMRPHLKASTNAALPTCGAPNVMHRTSEVGLCRAAQQAAMVAREPPTQKPVMMIRRGVLSPAWSSSLIQKFMAAGMRLIAPIPRSPITLRH